MICIIEGADGSGKSTLSTQLAQRMRAKLIDHEGMAKHPKDIGTAFSQIEQRLITDLAEDMRGDIVMDRHFPSEWVYDRIFKRDFDEAAIWDLDQRTSKIPHLAVFLRLDKNRQTDDHVDSSMIELINFEFESYIVQSHMDWIEIDGELSKEKVLEKAMYEIVKRRNSRDQVFMELAETVAARSTCLSRRTGAVLVSPKGHLLATGYNGAPAGLRHQRVCDRIRSGASSSTCLDRCNDVHAEENVIAQSAMYGKNTEGAVLYTLITPCTRCARMLINAGISEIVFKEEYADDRAISLLESAKIDLKEI